MLFLIRASRCQWLGPLLPSSTVTLEREGDFSFYIFNGEKKSVGLNLNLEIKNTDSILRSTTRHQLLLVLRSRLSTFGRRAFPVAGVMFWNSLPDELQTYLGDRFMASLKTFLFGRYWHIRCISAKIGPIF